MNTIKLYTFKLLSLLILIPLLPIALILVITSVLLIVALTILSLIDSGFKLIAQSLSVKHKELQEKQEKQ